MGQLSPLQRWLFYFFTGNILFFWLTGLNYLTVLPWLDTTYVLPKGKVLFTCFAALCYLGQLGLLALLPLIFFLPLSLIVRKPKILIPLAVFCIVILTLYLMTDSYVYKLYRFHLSGTLINLVTRGSGEQVLGVSNKELLIISLALFTITACETLYAWLIWKYNSSNFSFLKWFLFFSLASLYLSYSMIVFSFGFLVNRVFLDITRTLPLYDQTVSVFLSEKNYNFLFNRISESYTVQPKKFYAPLNYPLHALTFSKTPVTYNLVIIVIDTWRFDMLDARFTPTLSAFAKQSLVFHQHRSGGNATGPGIFSLFYGLPASYWSAMEMETRGPVLLNELIKRHYHMKVFSSAELFSPPLNKTVFADLKTLDPHQQSANTAYERDKLVTRHFQTFLSTHLTQPFFSFLFYDAAHSYCEFDDDLKPFQPVVQRCNRLELNDTFNPTPYFNRYKNALLLVDNQINQVLKSLKNNNLLKNTIVIITGDHGEEFNDNHLGYWGHASNFTKYQTQTPLIVYWPGTSPREVNDPTSHFDVVPTLMQKMLHCQSPIQDYALGNNLFYPTKKNYYLIGSYISLGVIEPHQITEISQSGNFVVKQQNGQHSTFTPNREILHQVFNDMQRFLKLNTP